MGEPQWMDGDDDARGLSPICDDCDSRHDDDESCGDPDAEYEMLNDK